MANFNLLQTINPGQVIGNLPGASPTQEDGFGDLLGGLGALIGKGNTKPKASTNQGSMSAQMGLNQGALAGIGMNPSKQPMQDPQTRAISNNLKGYDLANSMVGMNEVKDNSTLHSFLQKGGADIDPANIPWCAAFANGILKSNGMKGTGSLAARSFLNYGTETKTPSKGDIVVLSRGNDQTKGHVGFYAGTDDKGNVLVLGGNQGNSVSIKSFSPQQVLGYRQPPTGQQIQQIILPKNPNPELGHVMQGISNVESQGDYNMTSKASKNGDRAYGKYQIMGNNIPAWTTEALGHPMTAQQFLADPQAQERVAAFKLNQSLQQGYSPEDAASIWFSGRPQNKAGNAKDAYGTSVPQYINKFNKGYLQSKSNSPMQMTSNKPAGMITPGNIDLNNRPRVSNPDGSYSTVRTMTFEEGGKTIMVPTIINGKQVSTKEAIDYYHKTGQHMGIFKDQKAADQYDEEMHKQQGWTGPQNQWPKQVAMSNQPSQPHDLPNIKALDPKKPIRELTPEEIKFLMTHLQA